MSFNDFNKDDLDFGDLITDKKPKSKKFPKPSEGLRFLSRNLQADTSKRHNNEDKQSKQSLEKVLEKQLQKSPSPTTQVTPNDESLKSSIDKKRAVTTPQESDPTVLKSTIDKTSSPNTTSSDLNSSIDSNRIENHLSNDHDTSIDRKSTSNTTLVSSIDNTSSAAIEPINALNPISSGEFSKPIHRVNKPKIIEQKPISKESNASIVNSATLSEQKIDNEPLHDRDFVNSNDHNLSIDNNSTNEEAKHDHFTSIDIKSTHTPSVDKIRTHNTNDHLSSIDEKSPVHDKTNPLNSSLDSLSTDKIKDNTQHNEHISSIDVLSSPDYSSIKLKGNFTKLSNHIFEIWKTLDKSEKILLIYLYRTSFGWNKIFTNIPLSIRFLEKALPLTHNSIPKAIKGLSSKGIVNIKETTNLGSVYELNLKTNDKTLTAPISDYYTPLDNNIFELSKICSASDFIVYLVLYRFSYGFHQNVTKNLIRTSQIAKEVGLSIRRTQDAIRNLIDNKLVKRITETSSKGLGYRVYLPQEVLECENSTQFEVAELKNKTLDSSIDILSSPKTSTDINNDSNSNSSIDNNSTSNHESAVNTENSNAYVNVPNPSVDKKSSKEIQNTKKTSSGDADDFFNFLNSKFSAGEFTISKTILTEILNQFGLEASKTHLERLLPRIKDANSPVGLWRDSLLNPEKYPELTQKSQQEITQEQRQKEAEQRRAAEIAERQKQEKIKRVNTAWDILDEMTKEHLITISKKHFEKTMKGKLPPRSVIVERAKRLNFEAEHKSGD